MYSIQMVFPLAVLGIGERVFFETGAEPGTAHVDRHRLVELVHFHFPERAFLDGHEISGVVDKNIDAAELLRDFVDHGLHTLFVRDVARHADRRAPHVPDRFDDVISAGDVR